MKPLEELIDERFVRASGPGGQNVNKVSSAVQLRYNVAQDERLNPAQRQRLSDFAGSRLLADGHILIDAKEYRSQEQNRDAARARLTALLTQSMQLPKRRRPTKPSRAARRRRMDAKTIRSGVKQKRGRPNADD